MIPQQAVEAAAKAAGLVFNEPANARDIEYIRTILEAAAPHMQCGDGDREEVEERVKEIVQDVAMTVDYTERMYAAVQEIMNLTMPRPTK